MITDEQYHKQRDELLLEQHRERNGGKKPLFDAGEDSKEKRRKLWEARDRGEISLAECLNRCAEIRLAEEGAGRRLLTESRCAPACDCADCDLSACREQLDEAISSGQMSKDVAEEMWKARLAMD